MSELIDPSLDYSVSNYNHSTLHFRNVAPQSSGDVTLSGSSVVGPTQFVISSSVFNPSKSRLTFDIQVDLPTGTYLPWICANTLSIFNRIVCYDMNTSAIFADINNAGDIYNMLAPALNKAEILRHKSGAVSNIVPSATEAPALASSQLRPFEDIKKSGGTNVNGNNIDISGDNDYFQVQQLISGSVVQRYAALRVSIPLSAFKHTFFDCDRMIYNPSNIAVDIYFEGYDRYMWAGTSAADPTANAATISGLANSVVKVRGPSIQLNLATEGNVNVSSQIIQKVMSSGLSMPIGYVTGVKQALTGSQAQSLTLPLTAAYGKKILYLATSPFNASGTVNLNKIHSKYLINGTTNDLSSYNSFINGIPILAPAGFNGTLSEDYMIANKQYLEGSCIQTINDYNFQWLHVDNFAKTKLCELDPSNVDGLDVTSQQANWQIQYNFVAATAYNHYIAIVGQKVLSITSQGATVA